MPRKLTRDYGDIDGRIMIEAVPGDLDGNGYLFLALAEDKLDRMFNVRQIPDDVRPGHKKKNVSVHYDPTFDKVLPAGTSGVDDPSKQNKSDFGGG